MSLPNEDAEVIVEAFARKGVVLAQDDPILALGTVVELGIKRGSQAQAELIGGANKELIDSLGRVHTLLAKVDDAVGRSMPLMESAAGFMSEGSKQVAEEAYNAASQGARKGLKKELENVDYRIDEQFRRLQSIAGGDHRWKDRMIGVLVGWSMALCGWIGYMYFVKH
jgi:hypothetical protein